jgi:carbon-monoxide dehydrogenase medium subunit
MALDARVKLVSLQGKRDVSLSDFYTGVRKTVIQPDEILAEISFPALTPSQKGVFIKYGLRKAQAISILNLAVILSLNDGTITKCTITLGAVAPTIIHASKGEEYLTGKHLYSEVDIDQAANLVAESAQPIDDIRGSAKYRQNVIGVMLKRALNAIKEGKERESFPADPVLLWGKDNGLVSLDSSSQIIESSPITTNINGQSVVVTGGTGQSLLRMLRENSMLTGVKEGCAEGECGACTIYLDGKAVMSCLVPAERAQQAKIITIEGISQEESIHPVQQAFIDEGAVQCGYCTPGFIMSAVKLLEEKEHPDREQVKQAITGNLCRCTGYYKIIKAIEKAGEVKI